MPDENTKDPVISFGPFRLFPKSRLLEKDGAPLHVGGRALDILLALAERPGEVVDKRDLIRRVWADVNVDEGSLRFHVTALRKALGDSAAGSPLHHQRSRARLLLRLASAPAEPAPVPAPVCRRRPRPGARVAAGARQTDRTRPKPSSRSGPNLHRIGSSPSSGTAASARHRSPSPWPIASSRLSAAKFSSSISAR